jgi:hypothetical protein
MLRSTLKLYLSLEVCLSIIAFKERMQDLCQIWSGFRIQVRAQSKLKMMMKISQLRERRVV